MARMWISVDGGGTKTEFCACDESGNIVFDGVYGNANYKASTVAKVKKNFRQGLEELLREAKARKEDIAGAVLGVSGLDSETDREVYLNILNELELGGHFYLCNDTELIFRALSDTKGICAVAGTGSIACAYDESGLIGRVGGWGAPASDIGSGYWIGERVIRDMIMVLDGYPMKEQPVFQAVEKRFKGKADILQCVLTSLSVQQTASVAHIVFEYAAKGDEYCIQLIRASAKCLTDIILALYIKTQFDGEIDIVTAGGLFENDTYFRFVTQNIEAAVPEAKIRFLRPNRSPAVDGLRFALKLFPS